MTRWTFAVHSLLILVIGLGSAGAAEYPLVGVWQLDPGQGAQAGLYMFTATHYSMVVAATDRTDIADTSQATADELRAYWGPLLANAGSYEIAGDLLTIHPIAAKLPVVMKAGANEVYRFRLEGKTLTLQQASRALAVDTCMALSSASRQVASGCLLSGVTGTLAPCAIGYDSRGAAGSGSHDSWWIGWNRHRPRTDSRSAQDQLRAGEWPRFSLL